jgi:hypothetical protein
MELQNNQLHKKIRQIQYFKILGFALLLVGVIFLIKYTLQTEGWAFAIGVTNLLTLAIYWLIPVEEIIGTNTILTYWMNCKCVKQEFLIKSASSKKVNDSIILTSSIENLLECGIENPTTANFLIKDSRASVAGYQNEALGLILVNAFILAVMYFGEIDLSNIFQIDRSWPAEAIAEMESIRIKSQNAILSASLAIQFAWMIRAPFLVDLRNKTYIATNILSPKE